MAVTGTFGGFEFDPEVFASMQQEKPFIKSAIIQSGILVNDETIAGKMEDGNNVGSIPFYKPIDAEVNPPKNYDGVENNTPDTLEGGKQTFMVAGRMKAWKAQDFTTELTTADPLGNVGNSISKYYAQVNQQDLMAVMSAAVQATGMENHITDISTQSAVSEKNLVGVETSLDVCNKACGDMDDVFTLVIMNSVVATNLKKKQLIQYLPYKLVGGVGSEIMLPTYNGKIVIEDDRGTVDKSQSVPVYNTFFAGTGAILTSKAKTLNPFRVARNDEAGGGTDILYTKQRRVFHPNGFSIVTGNIATSSPTTTELGNKSNWELKFNEKNIPLAMLKTNG